MKPVYLLLAVLTLSFSGKAQDQLPYYELPEYPETYTAGSVAARMIDGLGFRLYWATEGLRKEDLNFKPNAEARTALETLDHIYALSQVIVNATKHQVNETGNKKDMSWEEKRKQALLNLKTAADILRNAEDLSVFLLDFGSAQYPFWNAINGPIADAIWHCGQLASFRRSSGNPFSAKVSLFHGKVMEKNR